MQVINARLRKQGSRHILLGDFNMKKKEVETLDLNLSDAHEGLTFASRYEGSTPGNKIDFLLHSGHIISRGFSVDQRWREFTDHRPIWAVFPSRGPNLTIKRSASKRIPKKFSEQHEIEDYQNAMAAENFESLSAADFVEAISTASSKAGTVKARNQPITLWSPSTAGYIIRQEMISDLIRCTSQPISWREASANQIIERGRQRTQDIGVDGQEIWESLESDGTLLTVAQLLEATTTGHTQALELDSHNVDKQLHGKRRRQRQELIWDRIKVIKKDKYRFFKTMGEPRVPIDLTKLETPNGVLHIPSEIDNALTTHWQTAFAKPTEATPTWGEGTFTDFCASHPTIPTRILTSIWNAMYSVPEQKRAKVESDLQWDQLAPTLSEFVQSISNAPKKSAGGPTGATYKLLNLLPDQTKVVLYLALLECWETRTIPAFWNKKLLHLLGKKHNTFTIANIRPIVLIEVTRKLWFKLIVKKILRSLERHEVLQASQYGFRTKRSTSDNLLQFINALEGTAYEGLFGSSFDIVGAFNSPPRQWLEFSMRRLGIPSELASLLSYIDDKESIQLLTPHHVDTKKGGTFTSGRGCGQGDVISPLLWTVYFDIVLTALKPISSEIYYADLKHQVHAVGDTAFADDLLTLGATIECIQAKADIMSGCAIVMNFQLALHKFRTFSTREGGEIILHLEEWKPHAIKCSIDGYFTYLGSTIDMDGTPTHETIKLLETVKTVLKRITNRTHLAEHSRRYLNGALLPKLGYPAQFATLTQHSQSTITRSINIEYRKQLHLNRNFPTAVLHAPLNIGGLGLVNPTDNIGHAKWLLLNRALHSRHTHTRSAAESILLRASLKSNGYLTGSQSTIGHMEEMWLSDITRLLEATSLVLTQHNVLETNAYDTDLPDASQVPRLGIRSYRDIVHWNGVRCKIFSPSDADQPLAQWSEVMPFSVINHRFYTPGQMWSMGPQPTELYEIIGWQGEFIMARLWVSTSSLSTTRRTTRGHSFTRRTVCMFESSLLAYRCIFNHETNTLICTHAITGRRRRELPPQVPTLERPMNTLVATDGSYVPATSIFPEHDCPTTTGAVILMEEKPPYNVLAAHRFELPSTHERAFTAEVTAIAYASYLYPGQVLSDCQAAISALSSGTNQYKGITITHPSANRIKWTRSHPERRRELENWSAHDHAIFQADRVADGAHPYTSHASQEVLTKIHQSSRHWASVGPLGPILTTPLLRKQVLDITHYLDHRVKQGRALWSQAGLKYLIKLGGTLPQKGALSKLYLGHFLPDLEYEAGNRPQCSCGCRNILSDWISTCSLSEIKNATVEFWNTLVGLDVPKRLALVLYDLLQGEDNVLLFRGNWTATHRRAVQEAFSRDYAVIPSPVTVRLWRNGIATLTRALTTHSLALYHLRSNVGYKLSMPSDIRNFLPPVTTLPTPPTPTTPTTDPQSKRSIYSVTLSMPRLVPNPHRCIAEEVVTKIKVKSSSPPTLKNRCSSPKSKQSTLSNFFPTISSISKSSIFFFPTNND